MFHRPGETEIKPVSGDKRKQGNSVRYKGKKKKSHCRGGQALEQFPREAVESPSPAALVPMERFRITVAVLGPAVHKAPSFLPGSPAPLCPPPIPGASPSSRRPHSNTPGEEEPGPRRGSAAEGLNRGSAAAPGRPPAPPCPLPGHARPAPAAANSRCAFSGAGRRRPALSARLPAAPSDSRWLPLVPGGSGGSRRLLLTPGGSRWQARAQPGAALSEVRSRRR